MAMATALTHGEQQGGLDFPVLPYGDFAVALYASSLSPACDATPEMLERFAWEGMLTLGGPERVRQLHRRMKEIAKALQRHQISETDYFAMMDAHWPDEERLDWATGCDLGRHLLHR